MSLLKSLKNAFAPGARSPGAKTFCDLARETGAYAGTLGGYQPYLGDHEPPDGVSTEPRAKIVYDAILAAGAERVAEITALLEREGLKPGPNPEAWDAIGRWVISQVEGSREPGSAERAPFVNDRSVGPLPKQVNGESTTEVRPLWRSVAFDLSLLLGRSMMAVSPGGRWIRESELRGRDGNVAAAPRVTYAKQAVAHAPFEFVAGFMGHALALKLGIVRQEALRLGDGLRRAFAAAGVEPSTPEEEFVGELEELFGMGPLSERDVAELLEKHGLTAMPELPPHLAEGLAGRGA